MDFALMGQILFVLRKLYDENVATDLISLNTNVRWNKFGHYLKEYNKIMIFSPFR